MTEVSGLSNLEQLRIGTAVHEDLRRFLEQVVDFYGKDLISIIAFGSCVTGDYVEASSDINLLVVYSELNIADLRRVADLSRRWLSRRQFAPRFLSRRNLQSSYRYFPIDMLSMKEAHVVLWGEDLLSQIVLEPREMHWQLAHEIKRMRMRIKQQFWRTCDRPVEMKRVLLERFTSIAYLARALLWLRHVNVSPARGAIMDAAVRELGISAQFVNAVLELKSGRRKASGDELIELFTRTMDAIRVVDEQTEAAKP
ncbi:MAG: nucleotidyltransferase domain-containing protein [Spirochaetia bacterium]|jgi:predicted nucleotidyltransferase